MITCCKQTQQAIDMITTGAIDPRFKQYSEDIRWGRGMYDDLFGTELNQGQWCWKYIHSMEELNALAAGEPIDIDYTHIAPFWTDDLADQEEELFYTGVLNV